MDKEPAIQNSNSLRENTPGGLTNLYKRCQFFNFHEGNDQKKFLLPWHFVIRSGPSTEIGGPLLIFMLGSQNYCSVVSNQLSDLEYSFLLFPNLWLFCSSKMFTRSEKPIWFLIIRSVKIYGKGNLKLLIQKIISPGEKRIFLKWGSNKHSIEAVWE